MPNNFNSTSNNWKAHYTQREEYVHHANKCFEDIQFIKVAWNISIWQDRKARLG